MRILLTGASGAIGASMRGGLEAHGHEVVAVSRSGRVGGARLTLRLDDLLRKGVAQFGADAIIHLAGISHRQASAAEYQSANVDLTTELARSAGPTRFVFASSVKAIGELSERPWPEDAHPAPATAYGRSKLLAEKAIAKVPDLDWVALRLPLVHSPFAKAHFAALMRLAATPGPLPFADLNAPRSLISIDSAIAAFESAATKRDARGVFHLCDRPSLSPKQMIIAMREGLERKPNLFALGPAKHLLRLGPTRTLLEPLELDDTAFRRTYGYGARADIQSDTALRETAQQWARASADRNG